jgi:hypothetical protein
MDAVVEVNIILRSAINIIVSIIFGSRASRMITDSPPLVWQDGPPGEVEGKRSANLTWSKRVVMG